MGETQVTCPKCGRRGVESRQYCIHCGNRMYESDQEEERGEPIPDTRIGPYLVSDIRAFTGDEKAYMEKFLLLEEGGTRRRNILPALLIDQPVRWFQKHLAVYAAA